MEIKNETRLFGKNGMVVRPITKKDFSILKTLQNYYEHDKCIKGYLKWPTNEAPEINKVRLCLADPEYVHWIIEDGSTKVILGVATIPNVSSESTHDEMYYCCRMDKWGCGYTKEVESILKSWLKKSTDSELHTYHYLSASIETRDKLVYEGMLRYKE